MPTIQSLYPNIVFGTSCVRALVSQLTDEVVYVFTMAFIRYLRENNLGEMGGRVIFAHDLRPSSPGIGAACAMAIDHAGLRVEHAARFRHPPWHCVLKRLPPPVSWSPAVISRSTATVSNTIWPLGKS